MNFLFCDEPSPSRSLISDSESEEDDLGLDGIRSYEDPALVRDFRVLKNVSRSRRSRGSDYFAFQSDLKPSMRKTVTDWMLEVCEEEKCHPEVLHLAVNYLDRFLSDVHIKRSQFQLLACACMFLASKFKESTPLVADKLVIYTDFAFNSEEIIQWELLVLSVLNWDLSVVTPYTVLEQLLRRVRLESDNFDSKTVRRHAETFLALAVTEYDFFLAFGSSPATLSVASLVAAFSGFGCRPANVADIATHLCELTGVDGEDVLSCVGLIEGSMAKTMSVAASKGRSESPKTESTRRCAASSPKSANNSPAGTPTDLMDISHGLVC